MDRGRRNQKDKIPGSTQTMQSFVLNFSALTRRNLSQLWILTKADLTPPLGEWGWVGSGGYFNHLPSTETELPLWRSFGLESAIEVHLSTRHVPVTKTHIKQKHPGHSSVQTLESNQPANVGKCTTFCHLKKNLCDKQKGGGGGESTVSAAHVCPENTIFSVLSS